MSFDILAYNKPIDVPQEDGSILRYSAAAVQRIILFHMKYSEDTWFRERVWDEKFLIKQFPRMVDRFKKGWKPPLEARKANPYCPKCCGNGFVLGPHPDYPDDGKTSAAFDCDCAGPPRPGERPGSIVPDMSAWEVKGGRKKLEEIVRKYREEHGS